MQVAALILIATVAAPRAYFVDGSRDPTLLAEVVRRADPRASFAGRFAQAFVPCGTGCGSYWFVDRRSGAVIAAPNESRDGETVSDVASRIDSSVVRVAYGPADGVGACTARRYRLAGVRFIGLGKRMASPCELRGIRP